MRFAFDGAEFRVKSFNLEAPAVPDSVGLIVFNDTLDLWQVRVEFGPVQFEFAGSHGISPSDRAPISCSVFIIVAHIFCATGRLSR